MINMKLKIKKNDEQWFSSMSLNIGVHISGLKQLNEYFVHRCVH